VKKNGFLGRDTVIRKTMLDECKGDRLAEVLSSFSFAVVRKVVSDRSEKTGEHPALAQSLALENRGYAGERTELTILKLAHQVSLSRALQRKNDARAVYADFSELLDVKERGLARKKELVKSIDAQEGTQEVSEAKKAEVIRLVRNNWTGNEQWMETLLYGDENSRRDGLLGAPFDKVWRRIQAGRLSELDDRGTGLLEQLESRVRFHRERLQKWQGFRDTLLGDAAGKEVPFHDTSSASEKGLGLQLNAHQDLHLGSRSLQEGDKPNEGPPLSPEYAQLIRSLKEDLTAPGKPARKPLSELIPKPAILPSDRLSVVENSESEAISELEEAEAEVSKPVEPPPPAIRRLPQRKPSHLARPSRKLVEEELSRRETQTKEFEPRRPRRELRIPKAYPVAPERENAVSPPPSPTRCPDPVPPPLTRSPTKELISRETTRPRCPDLEPPTREPIIKLSKDEEEREPPKSPTQQEADDILASMNNSSPSPTKQPRPRHTLSLAERTRLSMARMSHSSRLFDEEEDGEATLSLQRPRPKPTPEPISEDGAEEYEDLVARTRKSMAGFEAARQKAQLERRRSQRKSRAPARREGSYFPKVEEHGQEDTSILAEELMQGEQNYEDVFMSRPKIKASPIPSPTKEWSDEDE